MRPCTDGCKPASTNDDALPRDAAFVFTLSNCRPSAWAAASLLPARLLVGWLSNNLFVFFSFLSFFFSLHFFVSLGLRACIFLSSVSVSLSLSCRIMRVINAGARRQVIPFGATNSFCFPGAA